MVGISALSPAEPMSGGTEVIRAPNKGIPFSVPEIGQDEIDAVVECLRSGWLTTGARCATFERDFADFIGGGVQTVAVSSCTAGLEIALAAHGIKAGDEVITSDYTFSASAMSAIHVGARPVLLDIDPETFNLDCSRIEDAITARTKAIIPVHFAGLACDMKSINDIARRHRLKVIEDAAHAFTTSSDGHWIGQNTSDATVFSFYATKTITTGEGGMITFADPGIAKKARALRLHGIDRDVFCRDQIVGASWRYEVVAAGFGYNMMDMVAAIGIVQLKRARGLHQARARLWDAYDAALADLPIVLPPKARRGDLHSCHLYAIRLSDDAPIDRDTFITEMARLGVNCSVHFIPLHLHRFWRETLHVSEEMFPNAQRAFERVVSLPLFPSMTIDTQCHITDAVRELLA